METEVKLTIAQEKAMKELTHDWKPLDSLHTRSSTLDALVRRGLVTRKMGRFTLFSRRRASTFYKLAGDSK